MTLIYARIANRTVADEYHSVSQSVEALYAEPDMPATASMRQLHNDYRRMLGNGWCTRPRELDCAFESVCEGCGFFSTNVEFKPRLQAQADHAARHQQPARHALFQQLADSVTETTA
jgi:hypothetical protein